MITRGNKEIFIYDSKLLPDKRALSYFLGAEDKMVVDVAKEKITPKQVKQVIDQFEGTLDELLDKDSEKYVQNMERGRFDDHDLIEYISENMTVLKTPIYIKDGRAKQIDFSEIVKKKVENNTLNPKYSPK